MHSNCIATEALLPGMVIVQVTKQNGPLKIRKSGLVTSTDMIQGLLEMGIQEVQIDPTQTVEIETPVVQSSTTLQLLQSGSGIQSRQDNQLHDQFNRSLFLPSVQDIPSAWQFYARRYALLTLIIFCGFALGYAVAYAPGILSWRNPLVLADVPPVEMLKSEYKDPNIPENTLNTIKLSTEQIPLVSTPVDSVADVAAIEAAVEAEPAQVVTSARLSASQNATLTQSTAPEPQPSNAVEPQLSPELVKRFENVIKQMDEEAASGHSSVESTVKYSQTDNQIKRSPALTPPAGETKSQDLLRIDQLPAWVMNELPSMSFSAHMYASNPKERWVRVNGQRMLEGDLIDNKVRIVQIASQHVILNYQGHEFSMLSMTDW